VFPITGLPLGLWIMGVKGIYLTAAEALSYNENSVLAEVSWFMKRTFQPKRLRRKRTHGFLARMSTPGGSGSSSGGGLKGESAFLPKP